MKVNQNIQSLKKRIKELEKENQLLKSKKDIFFTAKKTVKTPKEIEPIFDRAEKIVGDYFQSLSLKPNKGTIEINKERYVLVRASALSYEFFHTIKNLYKSRGEAEATTIGKNFLFDIGHVLGLEDAKRFHKKMKLKEPIEKLSAGPVHFAYAGWASVEILPESSPTPNEDFFLKYNHPYSFEADSWIKNKIKSKEAVCTMNAAYSSGWCQESFNVPLTAVEITCRAKGDKNCTFIMAHPSKIGGLLKKEITTLGLKKMPEVPFFFERKKIEEEFIKNKEFLNEAQKIAKLGSWEFNLITQELIWSDELYRIYQIDKVKVGKENLYTEYLKRMTEEDKSQLFSNINDAVTNKKEYTIKHPIKLPGGKTKWIIGSGVTVLNENKKVVSLMGIAQDVTEDVLLQEKQETNLLEKETLLKEIHHRVKNNLQIISSLLKLHADQANDSNFSELVAESQNRIISMALIHEMLYVNTDLSKINLEQYSKSLFQKLKTTYNNHFVKLKLKIPEGFSFEIDKMIPIGLIMNEILSNAFKYAFTGKTGEISISFAKNSLTISDNGIGFSKGKNKNAGFGLQLVELLCEQIDAKLVIKQDQGSIFEFQFV